MMKLVSDPARTVSAHGVSRCFTKGPNVSMLVDSHCHLDFPDFADDLDAIVERAGAAGVGRIVTISTRVRQFDRLLAISERFSNVYCSVGTHPHNAHEELDVTAKDLVEMSRHPK